MATKRFLHEIWVAEDDHGHYLLFLKTLESAKIRVPIRRFFDGQQAIDYFEQHEAIGDLDNKGIVLFLDLRLPKVSGEEVLRRIRSAVSPIFHELPVVVITSSCNPEDRIACHRLGCDAFLVKPFSPQQLDHAILLALSRPVLSAC
jgi:CheY-like chemotaxis protein